MSWGGWVSGLTHAARDNALVSPWAQGKLAYDTARPSNDPRQSPNPADRPGFYDGAGGTGSGWHDRRAAPAGPITNGGAWKGVAGGMGGRGGSTGAGNGAQGGAPSTAPVTGSESGPGILESWFQQRANGTDPGYEYAMKRGGDEIDNRMAAGGSYNSGARGQNISDLYANMSAQREGQLDALASGASGEHRGRLNDMFAQGLGLAGGESRVNSAYDLAAGGAMSEALAAALGFTLNKAGGLNQLNQQGTENLLKLGALAV